MVRLKLRLREGGMNLGEQQGGIRRSGGSVSMVLVIPSAAQVAQGQC
jgi:hypothetical protein